LRLDNTFGFSPFEPDKGGAMNRNRDNTCLQTSLVNSWNDWNWNGDEMVHPWTRSCACTHPTNDFYFRVSAFSISIFLMLPHRLVSPG
jgi:hypothetical protein